MAARRPPNPARSRRRSAGSPPSSAVTAATSRVPLSSTGLQSSSPPAWVGPRRSASWSPAEDSRLAELVALEISGPPSITASKTWSKVAQQLQNRTGKQCRERYLNQLKPGIRRDPWSPEEERTLRETHDRVGNKWVVIANLLPGRTDNCVKNHWNSMLRKRQRKEAARLAAEAASVPAAAASDARSTVANVTHVSSAPALGSVPASMSAPMSVSRSGLGAGVGYTTDGAPTTATPGFGTAATATHVQGYSGRPAVVEARDHVPRHNFAVAAARQLVAVGASHGCSSPASLNYHSGGIGALSGAVTPYASPATPSSPMTPRRDAKLSISNLVACDTPVPLMYGSGSHDSGTFSRSSHILTPPSQLESKYKPSCGGPPPLTHPYLFQSPPSSEPMCAPLVTLPPPRLAALNMSGSSGVSLPTVHQQVSPRETSSDPQWVDGTVCQDMEPAVSCKAVTRAAASAMRRTRRDGVAKRTRAGAGTALAALAAAASSVPPSPLTPESRLSYTGRSRSVSPMPAGWPSGGLK